MKNGYIIDAFKINNFYDVRFIPEDVDRGYYFGIDIIKLNQIMKEKDKQKRCNMDTILNFINDNSTVIMSIVSVGGFSIATFLISKITKSTVNVVVNYIANIVAKLFGGDSSITLDGTNYHLLMI